MTKVLVSESDLHIKSSDVIVNRGEIEKVIPNFSADDIQKLHEVAQASQDRNSEMNRLLARVAS